ncbi:hypothetical protein BDY21DRAFT_15157 [Lineolata rhizophorae]|uniref:F-box domain-containing protein n=1 Tax=Lineolata rhizophorae TaxID=578093 RepID=A0A6A6P1L3_9PEZI|nr:hypothetical protein BDY21DRAFT_15157 [Lineolata rhizophorae]
MEPRTASLPSYTSLPATPTQKYSRQNLPREVHECILNQLEMAYFGSGEESCWNCYLKDLRNFSLTCRSWDRPATAQLYRILCVPIGDDLFQPAKLFRPRTASRLKLLRRTLRERPSIARLVQVIIVPGLQDFLDGRNEKEQGEVMDSLASIVMACPRLERLTGYIPIYRHQFDRLTPSTPKRPLTPRRRIKQSDVESPLDQATSFLQFHQHWSLLETLFISGQSMGRLNSEMFSYTLRGLPSLRHLFLSNFDAEDFHDKSLLSLPALHSLRLESLPGLTDRGLLHLASSDSATQLRRLSLIGLEITFLLVVSRFVSALPHLRRFTLVQDASPGLMPGAVMAKPVFRSPSLEYMHWDVLVPGTATDEMVESIRLGALPNLRVVRAPSDHDGRIQDMCRPAAAIETRGAAATVSSTVVDQTLRDGRQPLRLIDMLDSLPVVTSDTHYLRTLPAARLAAQHRIQAARRKRATKIVVEDQDGVVSRVHKLRGFVGTVGSRLEYCLEPDVEGSEDAVVGLEDLIRGRPAKEEKLDGKAFCTGQRVITEAGLDRMWSHAPRQKYLRMELERFF